MGKEQMVSIYNYKEVAPYLQDCWAAKKKKNSNFSLRSWSNQLGMKAHGPLHQMIQGKRPVPKKYLPNFCQSLSLEAKETLYFETLLDLSRSKSEENKELYTQRLNKLAPKPKAKMLELETFKYLQKPIHTILLEMTALKDFVFDLESIEERLKIKISKKEIKEAFERLFSLGLLIKKEEKVLKANKNIYSQQDVTDLGLQSYHQEVCSLAAQEISKQPVAEREYNAYAISVKKSQIPKAKELIRSFMSDFAAEIEADNGEAEETYQLNVQFFKLTEKRSV